MSDTFIDECVVDGSALLEFYDANERGIYTYFVCKAAEHIYSAAHDGIRWAAIDQGDYEVSQT